MTVYPAAQQVALLLALMQKRAERTRSRLSEKTLKNLASRTVLRDAFIYELRQALEDLGILLVRLDRGGFALVTISALDSARPILVREYVATERAALRDGSLDAQSLLAELGLSDGEDEE